MEGAPQGPHYRSGMAAGLGILLAAGLAMAVLDVVHTRAGAPAILGLWMLLAFPVGAGIGVILGAGNATWGPGWVRGAFRALREDDALDRRIAAAVVAGALVAGAFVLLVAMAAVPLVGESQRKMVGGLLLGVVVVGALPVLALVTLPLYRVTHVVIDLLAKLDVLTQLVHILFGSRVVAMLVTAVAGALAAMLFVIYRMLDHQALNLASLYALGALPFVAVALGLLAYGPLAKLRERIPARGVLVLGGAVVAMGLPLVTLRGTPSEATVSALSDRSYLGSRAIPQLRKWFDRDRDGESAFFGGPDCDDSNPAVNSQGTEIPDNGIDENCLGGDGKSALAPAKSSAPTPPTPAAGIPAAPTLTGGTNVLVIFIDTLRADRLGFTGYQRDGKSLTPRLDAFAKESIVFKRAYAQAPNTPRSVPSFLGSRYPSQIKFDKSFKSYPTVTDDNELLFEVLKPAGFTTLAATSHFYFCDRKKYPTTCGDVVTWMNTNITQGVDQWDNTGAVNIPESNKDIAGPRIVEKATKKLAELAKDKTKFAMLVHLFEPHSTYVVHPGTTITERGTKSLEQKYDYEIAFEDAQIGVIFDALASSGLDKTTTVIVMADHGEAFGVHQMGGKAAFFHGDSLYNEAVHVPLMFRIPNAAPCMRDDVVQLVDLAPTITALFGVTAPASWQGRSLAPALACGTLDAKAAFSELLRAPDWDHNAKSMITADGKHHVYFRQSDSRWEVYDLIADPDERKNIADGHPQLADFKRQLTEWIEGPLAAGGGS